MPSELHTAHSQKKKKKFTTSLFLLWYLDVFQKGLWNIVFSHYLKKEEEKELYKGQKFTQLLLNIWLKGWQRAKISKDMEHVHSKAPSRKALLKFSRISGTDPASLPVHFSHMRSLIERGHEDRVALRGRNGRAACHSLSSWSGLTFISNHASCSICGRRQQQVQTVYSAIVLLPCSQKTGDSAFSQHATWHRSDCVIG